MSLGYHSRAPLDTCLDRYPIDAPSSPSSRCSTLLGTAKIFLTPSKSSATSGCNGDSAVVTGGVSSPFYPSPSPSSSSMNHRSPSAHNSADYASQKSRRKYLKVSVRVGQAAV